ncbi:MAG TPA: class I SAM-dependent methyltransferase [bacterium]|nr:class I SAM-dependent methyltransferase [bacterium]HEX67439.1 class I SAM-dependent methyltransferase [bacterium]
MKIAIVKRRGEIGKLQTVIELLPAEVWKGRILDVGCRGGKLGKLLLNSLFYCGVDLFPPATVIANVERGLPFKSCSFDCVVALDVLEHTDDIYRAFEELVRVSRKFIVITLPNCYEFRLRWRFLIGRRLSGKYGLPPDRPLDRHRWLISLKDAYDFVHFQANKLGLDILQEFYLLGHRRYLCKMLANLVPSLLVGWYLVLFQRSKTEEKAGM